MLHLEILKLRCSELGCLLQSFEDAKISYFCIFKAFKKATKLDEKGHLARFFEKWGGMCSLCPPAPPSMLSIIVITVTCILSHLLV